MAKFIPELNFTLLPLTEHPQWGLDIAKILLAGMQREKDRSGQERAALPMTQGNRMRAVTTFRWAEGAMWITGKGMPVVWTRRRGEGRVFYCSVGHHPDEFDFPSVGQVIRRGFVVGPR